MCFSNSFVTDVIGSKKVGTILKYKAANTTPHIKHRKSFYEKLGLITQRKLAIILKTRSKLTPFSRHLQVRFNYTKKTGHHL